jgi:hypothetical protein
VDIPDFQTLMRPLLDLAADGPEHSLAEARELWVYAALCNFLRAASISSAPCCSNTARTAAA